MRIERLCHKIPGGELLFIRTFSKTGNTHMKNQHTHNDTKKLMFYLLRFCFRVFLKWGFFFLHCVFVILEKHIRTKIHVKSMPF